MNTTMIVGTHLRVQGVSSPKDRTRSMMDWTGDLTIRTSDLAVGTWKEGLVVDMILDVTTTKTLTTCVTMGGKGSRRP